MRACAETRPASARTTNEKTSSLLDLILQLSDEIHPLGLIRTIVCRSNFKQFNLYYSSYRCAVAEMASDKKDGAGSELSKKVESSAIQEDLDLDKNPIKYATSEPGKFELDAHDKPYMEMTLRHGKHSDYVKRIMRQRIELRAKDFPRWPGDMTAGVRTMWIESRFWYDRERLSPDFDDDWRLYRARYIHSLELDPREPVYVPEYERELINPIRRFYMKPGDIFEKYLIAPLVKHDRLKSQMYRALVRNVLMGFTFCLCGMYYLRYNQKTWERFSGPTLYYQSPRRYVHDHDFPFKDYRTEPGHHHDRGFSTRKIFKDLRDYKDETVIL